jgi:DNA-binding response OmpR family regulator
MVRDRVRVLLIEDSPGDSRLIQTVLEDTRIAEFVLDRVDGLAVGLERLAAGGVDVVLLDLGLPDSTGLETFLRLQARASWIPIVVMSGLEDEEVALLAVQQGAQDYLLKRDLLVTDLVARSLCYAIERKRNESDLIRRGMAKSGKTEPEGG